MDASVSTQMSTTEEVKWPVIPEGSSSQSSMYEACMVVIYLELAASIVTILANPITIMAMVSYRMLKKTATNLFIVSLCTSDFCLGLSVLLGKTVQVAFIKGYRTVTLRVVSWFAATLLCVAFFSSLLHVILIGADRAIATVVPLKHRSLVTVQRAVIVLGIMWFFICILTFAPITMVLWGTASAFDLDILIYPTEIFPPDYTKKFTTPYILVCLVGSSILYGIVVRFYFKATSKVSKTATTSTREKKGQKMTRMIITIVSILVVLNGPIITLGAIHPPKAHEEEDYDYHNFIYELSILLMVLPTFINNFVYAWHLEEFRWAYMKLFRCYSKRVGTTQSTSGSL